MLGKLKIRCDFKDKGCKEVLFLENLSQHTVKCRYNCENQKKKCKKCLCEYPAKSSHDCVKALLELNKKANEEIEALKCNSSAKSTSPSPQAIAQNLAQNMREQSLLREIRELKSEKENFLKTIQDMSNSVEQKRKSGIFAVSLKVSKLYLIIIFLKPKTPSTSKIDTKANMSSSSEVICQSYYISRIMYFLTRYLSKRFSILHENFCTTQKFLKMIWTRIRLTRSYLLFAVKLKNITVHLFCART